MTEQDASGQLRCGACNSKKLTPPGKVRQNEPAANFGSLRANVTTFGARLCLKCGYLMLFADEDQLKKLKQVLK